MGGIVSVVDPEQTSELAPLVTLHKEVVDACYAIKGGSLVVRFRDGRAIRVGPDGRYESWNVSGELPTIERRFSVLAVPGGGVAVF